MKRCFAWIASSLLLACVLAVPAFAVTRTPGAPQRVFSGTLQHVKIGSPSSTHVACSLGETRPPYWINAGYLYPPNDHYYTLLRVADCPSCGPGGLLVTNAHAILWFDEACDFPAEVSIVRNVGTPDCPKPDRSGATLCGPYPYLLSVSNPGGYDFIMALQTGCCITDDAFLLITFPTFGTCGTLPSLVAADVPCNPCFSYNDNPAFGFIDMCADPFWQIYNSGNPNMYVDTDCCVSTPTVPHGWGTLKQLYR
jgi:hypothetical protein